MRIERTLVDINYEQVDFEEHHLHNAIEELLIDLDEAEYREEALRPLVDIIELSNLLCKLPPKVILMRMEEYNIDLEEIRDASVEVHDREGSFVNNEGLLHLVREV